MADLLESLNAAQKEAVTYGEGPLLIIAGAGTGKTMVITRRIAWLLEQGKAKAEQILALTFTEKAAQEMEERVDQLLPFGYLELHIQTFHAFCEELLRRHAADIGLSRDFTVLTELDAWLLVRKHLDTFPLAYYRPKGNPTRYIRAILSHISSAKDEGKTAEDYAMFARRFKEQLGANPSVEDETEAKRWQELSDVYARYEQLLREKDALDFGDLLLETRRLLQERPNILAQLQERFSYVLVDEFQDTNAVQYELVQSFAAPKNNLTVVGDDDQAIYQFRGASVANLLRFREDYPLAHAIVLTENYRSAQQILDRAHSFIQGNNPRRLEVQTGLSKKLVSFRPVSGRIEHLHAATLSDEASLVANRILALRETQPELPWSDVAVLVRANDHAEPFVAAFEQQGIPYQFLAQRGLYTKPIILDMLAWMRVLLTPAENVSAYRIAAHPLWQIPTGDLQRLCLASSRHGKPLWELFHQAHAIEGISPEAVLAFDHMKGVAQELADLSRRTQISELFIWIARKSGLYEHLNQEEEGRKRISFRYLQQFLERVRRFERMNDDRSLFAFMEEFAHERTSGEAGELAVDIEEGPDVVRVMTIHGSKGLEFRHVFIANLVDRRFPASERAQQIPLPDIWNTGVEDGNHIEEERRLMYVAMTRAKEGLFFTSADDYGGARKKKLSRFLEEMDFTAPNTVVRGTSEALALPTPSPNVPVVYELPTHFSFTQLQAFETCPLQYKLAHVLKIPTFGKYTMSFGKSMHAALQIFFEAWIATGVQGSREDLLRAYEASWISEWYPNDAMRETYKEEGRASLITFYANLEKEHPVPFAVEKEFTYKLGGVILRGRIDRLDAFQDGLHIIDYKTGTPKTLEDLRRDQKEQLLLYKLAVEELYEKPVHRLSFYYLEDNSVVDVPLSEKNLADVEEHVLDAVKRMAQSTFDATPGRHCRFCDFVDICEFRDLSSL